MSQPNGSTNLDRSRPAPGQQSTARAGGSVFTKLCLERLPAGRSLNIGAGYTANLQVGGLVIGIDLDPTVLKQSIQSAAADVNRLPFPSGVFTGALLKDVLEHVPDPVGALREVRRVCSPGAEVIVTVPRAIPRAVWADPTHLRGFTAGSIQQTMQLGGWSVIGRIDRMGSIPGAGRLPTLLRHSHQILRVPGIGHRLGTNWLLTARRND